VVSTINFRVCDPWPQLSLWGFFFGIAMVELRRCRFSLSWSFAQVIFERDGVSFASAG